MYIQSILRMYIHVKCSYMRFFHFSGMWYTIVYIRNDGKEADMKVTRRSDNGKSGHLLISVPASTSAVLLRRRGTASSGKVVLDWTGDEVIK